MEVDQSLADADLDTDAERLLIEAAQADPARFVELYDRHVDRVYAYVSRRAGSRTIAEDVTSEVFEQALTNLGTFEWRGVPFAAWLYRIASNALADHWKRAGRVSHELPPDVPDEREHRDLERRVSLFQLVDRLPDTQRQVIQMRFVEDRSIREVAAALDRSEGAVKQLQLRAIDNLRKGIEERPAARSRRQGSQADQQLPDRLDEVVDALVARGDASAVLRDVELAPLARVAADLRHYPGREFTARLRARLERRTTMATAILTPAVREGFTTVTPYVWVPDRGFADFLIRTFDAAETRVAENPGHGIHREMRIGDSMVMIGESGRTDVPARSVAFHVFVADADATFARALAAGAMSLGEPEDRHYGERAGFVADPYGNHWYIATALGPQSLGHALRTVTPYLHAHDVNSYMQFLARAFAAVEETRAEQPGGVIPYARMRIGDAAVEFGTREPMPGSYFVYVADPDAVYHQALAAGARTLSAPADQPSGIRIGFIEDPVGNHWYIARPAR